MREAHAITIYLDCQSIFSKTIPGKRAMSHHRWCPEKVASIVFADVANFLPPPSFLLPKTFYLSL